MSRRDSSGEYLAEAETVLSRFQRGSLVTDEAELLRGCLAALVAIGLFMDSKTGDTSETPF